VIDEIKNILLAGIGTAAYTYEKASETIESLVKKGQLTVEQGKELSEELKKTVKSTGDKADEKVKPITKEDMVEILKSMNFATKDEIDDIKNRLTELENKKN
jgi:polyhydroxyalkanoate synthesis regulator phasin